MSRLSISGTTESIWAVGGWLAMAAAAIAAGAAVLHKTSSLTSEIQPEYAAGVVPKAQALRSRVWSEHQWSGMQTLMSTDDVAKPAFPRVSRSGDVSVLDVGTYSILTWSNGRLTRSQIPDAILAEVSIPIMDMFIDGDSFVWLCGPNGKAVGFRGAERRPLPAAPNKLATAARGLYVMHLPGNEQLFERYDPADGTRVPFGALLRDQKRLGVILDGKIAPSPAGTSLYFAPNHNSFVAGYDQSGRQRFMVETIDHRGLPRVTAQRSGAVFAPSLTGTRIDWLSADDDSVFALVRVVAPSGITERALDVYSASDGAYQRSFRLPPEVDWAMVSTHGILTLGRHGLQEWAGGRDEATAGGRPRPQ